MQIITYSQARDNLKAVLDKTIADADVTVINRRDGDNAVLMSQAMYDSMQETLFLLSNPANARHLLESIEQLNAGKAKRRKLTDA